MDYRIINKMMNDDFFRDSFKDSVSKHSMILVREIEKDGDMLSYMLELPRSRECDDYLNLLNPIKEPFHLYKGRSLFKFYSPHMDFKRVRNDPKILEWLMSDIKSRWGSIVVTYLAALRYSGLNISNDPFNGSEVWKSYLDPNKLEVNILFCNQNRSKKICLIS